MRLSTITAFAIAVSGLFAAPLSAADRQIPVVWKSSDKNYADFQTIAFGFLDGPDDYVFVFQIKDLARLLEAPRPTLICSFNTDNNVKTGLFKEKGWDLQLNVLLDRCTVSAMVWTENKLETAYTFTGGEYSVDSVDDKLFIRLKKTLALKKIAFGETFTVSETHASKLNPVIRTGLESGEAKKSADAGTFSMPDPKARKRSAEEEE